MKIEGRRIFTKTEIVLNLSTAPYRELYCCDFRQLLLCNHTKYSIIMQRCFCKTFILVCSFVFTYILKNAEIK